MRHARPDYQERWPRDPALDDPSLLKSGGTPIAEDEPVMLFRAQGRNFPRLLQAYARMLREDPKADADIVWAVERHAEEALLWQAEHGCKTPDL